MVNILCCDCGQSGGALKQIADGRYRHISPASCKLQPKPPPKKAKRDQWVPYLPQPSDEVNDA